MRTEFQSNSTMQIGGSGGMGAQIGGMNASQATDSYSKNIQQQISNAQQQLQELAANKDMSIEEKMNKRQEIQKQIAELNNQLRQHQIEQRKEKQQGKKQSSMDDMLGANSRTGSKQGSSQGTGLSQASMQAIISGDTAVSMAEVQGSVANRMEGRAGVLKVEIKQDAALKGNTAAKEEELAEVEQKAMQASATQMSTLGEANKIMEEAAKEDKDEEKNEGKEAEKTETGGVDKEADGISSQGAASTAETAEHGDIPADEKQAAHYVSVDIRL